MKYTKTTLMELSHKYASILRKCVLLNLIVFSTVPAFAITVQEYLVANDSSFWYPTQTSQTVKGQFISYQNGPMDGKPEGSDTYYADGYYIDSEYDGKKIFMDSTATDSWAQGGALYIEQLAVKDSLSSSFKNNKAWSLGNADNDKIAASGGAVVMYAASNTPRSWITNFEADFTNNEAIATKYAIGGGALLKTYNYSAHYYDEDEKNSIKITNMNANFVGNVAEAVGSSHEEDGKVISDNGAYAQYALGGGLALINRSDEDHLLIENLNGDFTDNKAETHATGNKNNFARGGAIAVIKDLKDTYHNGSTIGKLTGNFENNQTIAATGAAEGGAIYIDATSKINELSGKFTNNEAKSTSGAAKGGAIYNDGYIKLKNAVFSGNKTNNTLNDIYNGGTIDFEGNVVLDGGITGSGIINFANSCTLTAKLLTTTILANSITFKTNNTLNFIVDNTLDDGEYDFIQADTLTGLQNITIAENPLYNLSMTSAGRISVSQKQSSNTEEELIEKGVDPQTAHMIVVIASSSSTHPVAKAISEVVQSDDIKTAVKAAKDLAPTTSRQVVGISKTVNNVLSRAAQRRMAALGKAGGDLFVGGSVWAQGLYNHSKQDSASGSAGFKANTKGVAFGVDGKVNEAVTVGLGYGYTQTKADSEGRDVDVDGHNVFVYGQYQPNAWYVNAMFGYGFNKYEETKSPMGIRMKSKYDVNTYAANVTTGYDFDNGLTPEAGLRYVLADQESYNDGAQHISTKNDDVLTAVVGMKYTTSVVAKNWTFKPAVRVATLYDVLSDDTKADVNVIGGGHYQITGKRLHRFGVETDVGMTGSIDNWDLTLEYNGEFRKDFQSHSGIVKAKYNF